MVEPEKFTEDVDGVVHAWGPGDATLCGISFDDVVDPTNWNSRPFLHETMKTEVTCESCKAIINTCLELGEIANVRS